MIQSKHRRSVIHVNSSRRYLILGVIALAVMLVLVVLIVKANTRMEALDTIEVGMIEARGILRVGIRDDMPGFSKDGEGLEIRLANAIGDYILQDKAGNSVEFVTINPRMTSAYLNDGSIDIAIMQLPQGMETGKYSYSASYYSDTCVFAVTRLNTEMPLKNISVGYINDTICKTRLIAFMGENNPDKITAKPYASYDMMLKDLTKGEIMAAVITGAEYNKYQDAYTLFTHTTTLKNVEYAVVSSTDSTALTDIATSIINALKASGEL